MSSNPPSAVLPVSLAEIIAKLEAFAPLARSESWDNVGLLAGDRNAPIERVMTCLTISRETVREAIERRAQLIVSHHPLPFKPLSRIVADSAAGSALWSLLGKGIAIYSPHTAWDNAPEGINEQLASILQLSDVGPLARTQTLDAKPSVGIAGRLGSFDGPRTLREIVATLRTRIPSIRPTANFPAEHCVRRVAIVCGSGGNLIELARAAQADLLLTGEATYHQCLESQSLGFALLMIGHFDSERFSMDWLADRMASTFPTIEVWASRMERDPVISIA